MQNRDQYLRPRGKLPAAPVERPKACFRCRSCSTGDGEMSFYAVQIETDSVSNNLHVFVLIHAKSVKTAEEIGMTFSIFKPNKCQSVNYHHSWKIL